MGKIEYFQIYTNRLKYLSGETLNGYVELKVNGPVVLKTVELKLNGLAYVRWYDSKHKII
jgi:hypothetical protein